MTRAQRGVFVPVMAIIIALAGMALCAGGVWLITLGGSWFYLIAGLAFLVTAYLLLQRSPAALWLYALIVAGTLAWALWEVGLDWWPLAARGDVIFVIGALLLLPWVTRALGPERVSAFRGGGLALTGALLVALIVAGMSFFNDRFTVEGTVPGPRAQAADARSLPPGEWHAYGRTAYGQRYSPLTQITPAECRQPPAGLELPDRRLRGQPAIRRRPPYEVTPLKIGDRLFLCTPHQAVIALDATTGARDLALRPQDPGRARAAAPDLPRPVLPARVARRRQRAGAAAGSHREPARVRLPIAADRAGQSSCTPSSSCRPRTAG